MRRRLAVLLLSLLALFPALAGGEGETLALVLSGGGGRGLSEIPVLQELDRRGIVPDLVVGSSMGALLGGLYAAGYTGDEILALVQENNLEELIFHVNKLRPEEGLRSPFLSYDTNLVTFTLGKGSINNENGLLNDQYLNSFLKRQLAKVSDVRDFDQLSIPFRSTGADVTNVGLVVFGSGPLYTAIRSSISLPMIFEPVQLDDGRLVMDGGMENNLPVTVARDFGTDVVLAVDVNDKLGILGPNEPDLSSLAGSVQAFNDFLTLYGAAENYEAADWVIVTDTADHSSLDFKAVDEYIQRGEDAVEASQEVFDELERRFGGRTRILYRDLEDPVIADIVCSGLSSDYVTSFMPFLDRKMTAETLEELEEVLEEIRMREKLKKITYDISEGIIYVTAEGYPSIPAALSLGFHGRVGLLYDKDMPYLTYHPEFVASGYTCLRPHLDLIYGAKVDEGIQGYVGLEYPIQKPFTLYGFFETRYGELFWRSTAGIRDYNFSNSLRLRTVAGGSIDYGSLIRLDAVLGVDYTWVSRKSADGLGTLQDTYVYTGFGVSYDGYRGKKASDSGVDAKLRLTFGGDFPDPMLGFELDAELLAIGGPSDYFKFLFEAAAGSARRPSEYAAAWRVTKMGELTPDDIFLMGGVHIPLPSNLYVTAGIYLEAASSKAEDYYPSHDWELKDILPFSTLDSDGLSLGGYLSAGLQTSFGKIGADLYISDAAKLSLMIGLE